MLKGSRVIIVGGGAIGCAIAYYLAKTDVSVTVLEKGSLGGEASSAAAGMLAPLAESREPGPFLDLGLRSLHMYPGLARDLEAESGIDVEFVPSGILRVAQTPEEVAALQSALVWQRARGVDVSWLDQQEAHDIEPELAPDILGGAYAASEAHVSGARLVAALARAAIQRGVEFREGVEVTGLLHTADRVTGVRTLSERLDADHVVLAAGAWSSLVAESLGVALPITPVRGQIVSLRPRALRVRRICFSGHGYLCPKPDGTVLVGSTQENAGFDRSTTATAIGRLLRLASTLVPSLADAPVKSTWGGLRPGSPDGYPLLGPLPGWEGLTIASGHFRNGILLTPVTGHVIAQLVSTGSADIDLTPFSPARFL